MRPTFDLPTLRALAEKAVADPDSASLWAHYREATPASVILRLLDELEAARRVVEAARYARDPALLTDPPRFPLRDALAAYDAAVAKGEGGHGQ